MALAADPKRRHKLLTIRSAAAKQRALLHDVDKGKPCLSCGECPGFVMHYWRKVCLNCRCSREDHSVEFRPERLRPLRPWLPVLEKASAQASELASKEQQVAAVHQDPKHDHSAEACVSLKPEHRDAFEKLQMERLKEFDYAAPQAPSAHGKCTRCSVAFITSDKVVAAPRLQTSLFHVACFRCSKCSDLLLDLAHYVHDNELFCGRCHAERFLPRCRGCDELIFDKTYTLAEGHKWHIEHFCCYECDVNICDVQYAKGPHGNCCCLDCYSSLYAPRCGTCEDKIEAGVAALKVSDVPFHQTDACFRCARCKRPLKGERCAVLGGELLCQEDFRKAQMKTCVRCSKEIASEFVQAQGQSFHMDCFRCHTCGTQLSTAGGEQGAYPVGGRLLCFGHAREERLKSMMDETC